MKLEVGKYYIRRDGETTDALVSYSMWDYKFRDPKFDEIYLEDGRDWDDSERPCDLIAEAPIDDKDVRIQELINSIDDLGFYVGDLERERDTLKERVQELEKENTGLKCLGYTDIYATLEQERDELRTQLEAAQSANRVYMSEKNAQWQEIQVLQKEMSEASEIVRKLSDHNLDLEAKLADAEAILECYRTDDKPKAPTVVKQTWQAFTVSGSGEYGTFVKKSYCSRDPNILGYIRRDHYSDGKVIPVLEPVGDVK